MQKAVSTEYCVHLVGGNRLSACREFCGVHSWQNSTRCRDGVKKYCGVIPIQLGWFLRVHPYRCLFSFRKLFCDLFLLFFFRIVFLGMVRKKRHWRVLDQHAVYSMIVQNFFVHKELRVFLNSNASKRNCKSKHQTPLSVQKPKQSLVKPKRKVHGFNEALHTSL